MTEVNGLGAGVANGCAEGGKLSPATQRLVEEWLELDRNPKTCAEIRCLADQGSEQLLTELLGTRMSFGTAGLRAKMGAGYSQMNDLTVIQTTQGLLQYLCGRFGEGVCRERGVAIGYDARHNSLRFAQLAAAVFLQKECKVYLFSKYTPTPFNPYAVRKFRCVVGIQVTASHNPKIYNGYKVYWDNGAQIIPPHDAGIAAAILANLTPWGSSWDADAVAQSPLVSDPLAAVEDGYFNDIQKHCHRRTENASIPQRVVFTPMHGVGGEAVQTAFACFALPPLVPVPEQMTPDPDFPTVRFPNPEEGKSALELAMRTADSVGSSIILATDPDADRLALAEKNPVSGLWKVFNGNELGSLMGVWAFEVFRRSHPDFDGSKVHMLASTVSSKFLWSVAAMEGFQFEETLTGFKWMGNRTHELMSAGHHVLFAFEEAIGFMFGTTVLDKDGVSAAAVMAEYGGWLYAQGESFHSQLEKIYLRYGRHKSSVSYYICESQDIIKALFTRLRKGGKYPTSCGPAKVVSVLDLTVGYDSSRPPDHKPVLPTDANCQLITFHLDNQCVFTLRTSGTEPKIKYYVEVSTPPGSTVTDGELSQTLDCMVKSIIGEFLLPERFGLIPRPT